MLKRYKETSIKLSLELVDADMLVTSIKTHLEFIEEQNKCSMSDLFMWQTLDPFVMELERRLLVANQKRKLMLGIKVNLCQAYLLHRHLFTSPFINIGEIGPAYDGLRQFFGDLDKSITSKLDFVEGAFSYLFHTK